MFILKLEIRGESVTELYASLQKIGGMHPPAVPTSMDYELKIYPAEVEQAKGEQKIS